MGKKKKQKDEKEKKPRKQIRKKVKSKIAKDKIKKVNKNKKGKVSKGSKQKSKKKNVEIVQYLNYDQNVIHRSLTIKDERYKIHYNFIKNSVFNEKNDLIPCSPMVRAQIDDDEKYECDQDKILCLDPDDNDLDDLYISMRAYKKSSNLETWSFALAQLLKRDSLNFKQQKLQNIFKDDSVKQNEKILQNMLSSPL